MLVTVPAQLHPWKAYIYMLTPIYLAVFPLRCS